MKRILPVALVLAVATLGCGGDDAPSAADRAIDAIESACKAFDNGPIQTRDFNAAVENALAGHDDAIRIVSQVQHNNSGYESDQFDASGCASVKAAVQVAVQQLAQEAPSTIGS